MDYGKVRTMERERVCTPEEAGKLLNDLKTVWQELSKAERGEVRRVWSKLDRPE